MKRLIRLLIIGLTVWLSGLGLILLAPAPLPVQAGAGDVYCVTPGGGSFGECTQVFTNPQAAVDAATGGEQIRLAGATYAGVKFRAGLSQTVYISRSLTLRGGYTTTNWTSPNPAANPTTLDAMNAGRVVYITGGGVVTLENLYLTNGKNSGTGGGGIYLDSGQLNLINNQLNNNFTGVTGGGLYIFNGSAIISGAQTQIDNNSGARGGAIAIRSGNVTLNAGQIAGNTASNKGGAVYVELATAVFTQTGGVITNNTSVNEGGGVMVQSGRAVLSGGQIISNASTTSNGGGVYIDTGQAVINGGQILSNTAQEGGGLFINSGQATLNGGQILSNTANNFGGGVLVFNTSAIFTQTNAASLIAGNSASFGGGLDIDSGQFIMSAGQIATNTATFDGGGLLLENGGLTLTGGQILSNTASSGGGVYVLSGIVTVTNSAISSNTATTDFGGGLNVSGGQATFTGSEISHNAANNAGGLAVINAQVTLNGGLVSDNRSNEDGGGILVGAGSLFTQTGVSTITGNVANVSGGGMYVISGTARLTGAEIINNTANSGGGVFVANNGLAHLTGTHLLSSTAGTGGGLYNLDAGVFITSSLVVANVATQTGFFNGGGGILNGTNLTLVNSAVVSNSSGADGGGLANGGGTATLTNTTLSGNSGNHGGGLSNNTDSSSATTNLFSSAVVNNSATSGGGVDNYGDSDGIATVNFRHTIVAGNSASPGAQCLATNNGSAPVMNSLGRNLESANECRFVAPTSDITNTNPLLGPLTLMNNTYIHPLQADSPAIDAGLSPCPIDDQRGFLRDAACDIGPYESDKLFLQPVNTAQVSLLQGATDDVLKVTASNEGGGSGADRKISGFELLFEDGSGGALTSGQANAILQNVFIYQDNGSGQFDGSDTSLAVVGTLALVNGRQVVSFPEITIPVNSSVTFFVVVEVTANAAGQSPHTFQITLLDPLGPDISSAPVTVVSQLFTVVQTNPAGNDRTIIGTGIISANFNRTFDFASVSTRTFTARGRQTGIYKGSYLPGSILFDSTAAFKPGEEIVVTLASNLEAQADAAPLRPFAWQLRAAVLTGTGNFKLDPQSLGNASSLDIALGDLDGDGDLDAFVANGAMLGPTGGQNNQVWLNGQGGNPVGKFSLGSTINDGKASTGVTLGDLDNDGDLDAFVTNWGQPDEIWLNDGHANFSNSTHPGHNLGGSSFGRAAALGDFNGDGYLDAFVANEDEPNTVWLNTADGSGHFTLVEDLQSNLVNSFAESWDVAAGDLNNDGALDVFIVNDAQPHEVWFNNGAGSFYLAHSFGGNPPSRAVALGDLNRDGFLDAVVANGFGLGYPSEVWLNNRNGSFTKTAQALGQENSLSVALGDVNADGFLDLIFGNVGPNTVWLNNGSASFSQAKAMAETNTTYGLALGDVDEDGDLDLFVANASPNELWLNGGQGLSTVYLPLILKSGSGGSPPQVQLTIQSDNTGTISLVQIKDPDNSNVVVPSCTNITNNATVSCGNPFLPIGNYQIVAQTARCGTLQGNFNDATGGPITRRIWCD